MERIRFVGTERHFVDHLAPVWKALPPDVRGKFYVGDSGDTLGHALRAGVGAVSGLPAREGGVVAVASVGDLQRVVESSPRAAVAYFEHGIGLAYKKRPNPSYVGSDYRPNVSLFLFPNEIARSRQMKATPSIRNVVLGSLPRLDSWVGHHHERSSLPVVALSWHFDCRVAPETRTALYYYRKRLDGLVGGPWQLIGHAHPRGWGGAAGPARVYERWGIEPVRDFEDVLRRADLLTVDNSSVLYEFAATGRPVLTINCPRYRRHVHHGLRFWDQIPGVQCDSPTELPDRVAEALSDPLWAKLAREAAVGAVFPQHDGKSAARAAEALLEELHAISG